MSTTPDLYNELVELSKSDMYPLHMPGHKRNLQSTQLQGAFRCDITEIEGFDNLHHEEGIILECEKRAARLYGSDNTFFVINGSTAGVLASVSAALPRGGTILATRGSHRSFYHAAYLRQLNISYLPYKQDPEFDIPDVYTGEELERALTGKEQAVFITSPTYEGKCADIRAIAVVCHKHGIPLIVDAAHGAHFGLAEGLPENAVSQGADIVIHSLHKTLPAMTQTALLHVNGNLTDCGRIKRFLALYQSSSPSYVLMSSIDLCVKEMVDKAECFARKLVEYNDYLRNELKDCRYLQIPGREHIQDPAKVPVFVRSCAMTGQQLYDILREEYSLMAEMAGEDYILAIITGWDTKEGIERFAKALKDIDKRCDGSAPIYKTEGKDLSAAEDNSGNFSKAEKKTSELYNIPKTALPLWKAWDGNTEIVPLSKASGRIAGDFVNLYPPGIPLIVPGEVVDDSLADKIKSLIEQGLCVQGITDLENSETGSIIENKGITVLRGID